MNSLEYSKSLLILPMVLHDPLINYLKDGRTVIKGIEDLILSKVEYFLNYNDRYFNYLSLSLNTIMFAEKMSYIKIEDLPFEGSPVIIFTLLFSNSPNSLL